jgi:monofunctional biosynthetic peptidoglycan transglycosylase
VRLVVICAEILHGIARGILFRTSTLLAVDVLWPRLTLAFEILFGRFVNGASWERLAADDNVLTGGVLPFGRKIDMKTILRSTVVLPLLFLGTFAMAEDTPKVLFEFTETDAAKQWRTVNDGVMGGVSEGEFKITEAKTLEFFGNLSLENNGGFASVRTRAKKLDLEKGDTLVVMVRGDGREYTLNLYVPRPLVAFSYRATVQTTKDEWIEVKLPLDMFEATSFGRPLRDAGPVDPKEVNALGFLLGDKKAGPFKLEVEWIKVERRGK